MAVAEQQPIIDERTYKPLMEREELRDVISLSLWAGQMLLQWGADSLRVEETVHRLGTGLGADWMDIVVTPDAIIATTINNHEFRTKVRRSPGRGVNMSVLDEINRISRRVFEGELDRFGLRQELMRVSRLDPTYSRYITVFAVAIACASFARLAGGDPPIMFTTFVASAIAMWVRQELHRRHFNAVLIVVITAFVAGFIASSAVALHLGQKPTTAIATAILLLVPGVPLINGAKDLIQGYTMNGIVRGIYGGILSFAIALGLSVAIWLAGVQGL